MDEDNAVYGPNPDIITDILEDSNFQLSVSPHERSLIIQHDGGYEVFCEGLPSNVFEDKITQLFDEKLDKTVEIRLAMDPWTDKPSGHALITFLNKEDAEKAVEKFNNYEIELGKKLKINLNIPNFAKTTNFPFEKNDMHICIKSSRTNYCTCIKLMIADIVNLLNNIREKELSCCKKKIEEAHKINEVQYAFHSLQMEDIEIPENLMKISNASQYAVDNLDNISLNFILQIQKLVEPEFAMFRTSDVYIFGIYGGRNSFEKPQPPAPELVIPEISQVVELMKSSLNMEEAESLILIAMTASVDFVMTHPFLDGNGRCSRVLFGSILKRHGFPWIIIPSTERTRYFEALESLRGIRNYTLIYRFLCRCILRSMRVYLQNLL